MPQSRHVHGLLVRGLEIYRALFPGIDADFDAAGVESVEWMRQTIQRMPTGWTPRYNSGLFTRPILRTTLEAIMRRRVKAIATIEFCEGWQVRGLIADGTDGNRVIGVKLEPRRHGAGQEATTLNADLVIDASGRGSHAGEWLKALGFDVPETVTINAHLGYATRMYRFDRVEDEPDWRALLMLPSPHVANGGGGVLTVMDNHVWMLTLAGVAHRVPPTDESEFNAYIRALDCAPLSQVLAKATPASAIYGYRRTESQRREYHQLKRMPKGFAVTGDAVCAFNPVYGQGMTMSAIAAQILDRTLREGWDELTFQRRLAGANAPAWLMGMMEDMRYDTTEGGKFRWLYRLLNRYNDWMFAGFMRSPKLTTAYLRVMHMLDKPTDVMRPKMILERIKAALR